MASKIIKVSFNIPIDELQPLKNMAEDLGITVTEAFRRAIKNQLFLWEIKKEEGDWFVKDKDGKMYRIIY